MDPSTLILAQGPIDNAANSLTATFGNLFIMCVVAAAIMLIFGSNLTKKIGSVAMFILAGVFVFNARPVLENIGGWLGGLFA